MRRCPVAQVMHELTIGASVAVPGESASAERPVPDSLNSRSRSTHSLIQRQLGSDAPGYSQPTTLVQAPLDARHLGDSPPVSQCFDLVGGEPHGGEYLSGVFAKQWSSLPDSHLALGHPYRAVDEGG